MQISACSSSRLELGCDSTAATRALMQVLDRVRIGVVMLDGLGFVLGCNGAARAILAGGAPLRERGGTLEPVEPSDQQTFRRLLDGACRGGWPAEARGLVLGRGEGRRPLELLAVPLDRHDADDGGPGSAGDPDGSGARAAALLLLHDRDVCRLRAGERALRELYRLTRAEARVASALLDGLTVDQAAERLGSSRHTVRTHLKHVLAKTGAHSQAEVVRMVLLGPLALLGPRGDGFELPGA